MAPTSGIKTLVIGWHQLELGNESDRVDPFDKRVNFVLVLKIA